MAALFVKRLTAVSLAAAARCREEENVIFVAADPGNALYAEIALNVTWTVAATSARQRQMQQSVKSARAHGSLAAVYGNNGG